MRSTLLVCAAAALLLASPSGNLRGDNGTAGNAPSQVQPRGSAPQLEWLEYGAALSRAKQEQKHVLIDFYTDWCGWCRRMDHDTYADSTVAAYLRQNFVLSRVNAESAKRFKVGEGTMSGAEVAREFRINSFPITWFLEPDGKKIDQVPGYRPPREFLKYLVIVHERTYEKGH